MNAYLCLLCCLAAWLVGYAFGRQAGIREHRADLRAAAAEWRECWLGDPPKASQTGKPKVAK